MNSHIKWACYKPSLWQEVGTFESIGGICRGLLVHHRATNRMKWACYVHHKRFGSTLYEGKSFFKILIFFYLLKPGMLLCEVICSTVLRTTVRYKSYNTNCSNIGTSRFQYCTMYRNVSAILYR